VYHDRIPLFQRPASTDMTEPRAAVTAAGASLLSGMFTMAPTRVMAYGAALGGVALAFLLRWTIYGSLDTRLPFAFFLPAAMAAAWYGGLGPGLLAAGLGLLLGDYFFLPPHVAWGPLGEAERTAITIYALTSTLSVVLFDNLHVRIRRLECELRKRDSRSGDNA
jgi:two-component system, sensor histidine kinase and response regulator